ncbi:MAG: hypothetical protein EOL87_00270 [Spartobacteria bacterium]|nr:hypothetical protein [Spartobacteria bacterium]
MRVGIIGAGHAGVAAAWDLAKAGVQVTLFSAEPVLPYFRPRIVAYAFGQATAAEIEMHPLDWYEKQNITLVTNEAVTAVETQNSDFNIRTATSETLVDHVIIASGAGPIMPPFARGDFTSVVPLWSMQHAGQIRNRLRDGLRMMIIGGGVIGIEAALRAADIGVKVSIVEKLDTLMARNFSPEASEMIRELLQSAQIDVLTGRSVSTLTQTDSETVQVTFEHHDPVKTDLVLMSIGAARQVNFQLPDDVTFDRGICVDDCMRTAHPGIWACGDIAQFTQPLPCTARGATIQGKGIAANIIAGMDSQDAKPYIVEPVAMSLKYKNYQFHSAGAVASGPLHEEKMESDPGTYRVRVLDEKGQLHGVQMVGTAQDFQQMSKAVEF